MASTSKKNCAVLLGLTALLSFVEAAPTAGTSLSERQQTFFVNVHGKGDSTGCTEDNYGVTLAVNDDSEPSSPENCVIYNSQEVLGNDFYNGVNYDVWFDAKLAGPSTRFIVRSPAGTDQDGCGTAIRVADTPGCYFNTLASTFLLQYCLGGTCSGGVGRRGENVTTRTVDASSHADVERAVADLAAGEGSGLVNFHVDKRTASVRSLEALGIHARQDASCWSAGATYTKLGGDDEVRIVGNNIVCSSAESCERSYTHTQSVSHTISVEATLGIKEIFELSFGYEYEMAEESTNTDTWTIPAGGVGSVTWTPIYDCRSGGFQGCANGDPADGSEAEMCTPSKDGNGRVRGNTAFVSLARTGDPPEE